MRGPKRSAGARITARHRPQKPDAVNLTDREIEQLPRNLHVIGRNPRAGGDRRLMVGVTDGGRALTLVIEATLEPTTWLVITGWEATARERKMLRS